MWNFHTTKCKQLNMGRDKLLKVRVEGEPKLIGHQVIRDVAQLYNHPTNHSCNPPHNLANLNNNMI